ncbi:MFS transporter [Winogradskya humida]|uniref:MFS transporter n=1 Tax=Winogradskya humida TaxID=113566 RepID=A0ABQ3ZXE1_9ACTN|nr:MFS transporter [Actinoplanes humidus]GIE23234.1 hypothetical protein Ahu01nite_063360 [Actinoplanes humidus]
MSLRRYSAALLVDALGAGLLRPFLLLYGLTVVHLSVAGTGLALSAGLLLGLIAVPLTGRWIDSGARGRPVAATMLIRAAGIGLLLQASGPVAFGLAALLLGAGSQVFPAAHAALVSSLVDGPADRALAGARAVRNAGLGVGALIAAVAVTGGPDTLRLLAAINAAGYLVAAGLVLSLPQRGDPRPVRPELVEGPALGPLLIANLAYALCFGVLEVALPALLVTRMHAAPAWSAAVFAGNTVLVVAIQTLAVVRLAGQPRRRVLAASGVVLACSYLGFWAAGELGTLGPAMVAAVAVPYTIGEILYAGSGTALVAAAAPAHLLGRALSRWQLSTGLASAAAPAVLTALLAAGPAALWGALTAGTLGAAVAVRRWAPAV